MYYITLDLEWNQAYAQKALAVQRQLCSRLRGEVIQIGAVKLNENMQPCGSYQVIVKPKYFKKLHRHVSELTGITQDMIDIGTPLTEAAVSFKKWCGNDFVFLTWGPDDIPMLKDVCDAVSVPVIASGGAGKISDFITLFKTLPQVDAGLAASIFHFGEVAISDLKAEMQKNDIYTRL